MAVIHAGINTDDLMMLECLEPNPNHRFIPTISFWHSKQ